MHPNSQCRTYCLPPTNEEVYVFAHVRLSVCLCARVLKRACTDLDKMLRVDSNQYVTWTNMDMDELNCAFLFLSELCQISMNFNKFW